MAGIDGYRYGPNGGDGSLELIFTSGFDVYITTIGGSFIFGCVVAFLVLSFVGVGGLGIDTLVRFDVLKGVVHQTAIATVVSELFRAVDQVLLGERHELARFAEVLALQRSSLKKCFFLSTIKL